MTLTIELPAEAQATLDEIARSSNRTASEYVRDTILDRLATEKRKFERATEIAVRAEAIRAGLIPTRPIEYLIAELGITQEEIDEAPLDLDEDDKW